MNGMAIYKYPLQSTLVHTAEPHLCLVLLQSEIQGNIIQSSSYSVHYKNIASPTNSAFAVRVFNIYEVSLPGYSLSK